MTKTVCRLTLLWAALALAFVVPTSSVADEVKSKVHDCGDGREVNIFRPTDGIMELRAKDLTVRIEVRDGSLVGSAGYSISLRVKQDTIRTGTDKTDDVLAKACWLISNYYKNQKKPSGGELRKELFELYDSL